MAWCGAIPSSAYRKVGLSQTLLIRSTTEAINKDPLSTVILLNTLRTTGYLSTGLSNVQGGRWRSTMTSNIAAVLERVTLTTVEDKRLLGQVLQLVHALGDLAVFETHLERIIRLALRLTPADWQDGVWNDGHILAAVLGCVNAISHTPIGERLRVVVWHVTSLEELVDGWSWNREVMQQVAAMEGKQ